MKLNAQQWRQKTVRREKSTRTTLSLDLKRSQTTQLLKLLGGCYHPIYRLPIFASGIKNLPPCIQIPRNLLFPPYILSSLPLKSYLFSPFLTLHFCYDHNTSSKDMPSNIIVDFPPPVTNFVLFQKIRSVLSEPLISRVSVGEQFHCELTPFLIGTEFLICNIVNHAVEILQF